MRNNLICLMISFFMLYSHVLAFEICGEVRQGELVVLKDGTETFLKAFDRDAPMQIKMNGVQVNVSKAKWDEQSVTGVATRKVNPLQKDIQEIKRERDELYRALAKKANTKKDWKKGFILPVQGRVSGNFGSRRIFNGIKKNPHTGTDIAAPLGTPVLSSGDGVVVLAQKGYFYTGNMIVIDHGDTLKTIYAHLNDISVKKGDIVKGGDIIGHVGNTGRATGAHLHWGAVLDHVRFRPESLLDINNKICRSY